MSTNKSTLRTLTKRKDKLEAELASYDEGKSALEHELEIITDTLEKLESITTEKPKRAKKKSKKTDLKLAANG